MSEHYLLCPKENQRYALGTGKYCSHCGTPLIEMGKPPATQLEKVRAAISVQVGKDQFPVLRGLATLIMVFGISLMILAFVIPPMLVTTSRVMVNSLQVSDGAGGNGPLPIYKDVMNAPSVFVAFILGASMFWMGLAAVAGSEFIKLFIQMYDELAALKNTVQHVSLLLVSEER